MKVRYLKRPVRILAALVIVALAAASATAQHRLYRSDRGAPCNPPPDCAQPQILAPSMPYVDKDGKVVDPKDQTPPIQQPAQQPSLADSFVSAAGGGGSIGLGSNVGYIDSALPFSHFRLRYDSAYNNNRPDRAEYFYAKCGCFALAGIDRSAKGPPLEETFVDYQTISAYLEYALGDRFSAFVDVPVRMINPDRNDNSSGLGDINFGAKYAFLRDCNQIASFQFRVYIPTGDPDRGLGNDHVTLEPALLYLRRLSERVTLEAMIKDWIPIGGTDFAGNVLQYGVGVGYTISDSGRVTVTPIAEVVGLTVLGGQVFLFPEGVIQDATGDTIINGKVGVRFGLGGGRCDDGGLLNRSDLYFGYARALTGDVWYKDSFRIEYRVRF